MKKTDISVSLRDGVRKRLKQYSRLLSLSLTASLLFLALLWQLPAYGQLNCSLGCHGAQVSLGIDCTAEITVAMIGDTSQCTNGDFTVFVITLQGDTLDNATVTGDNIGQTLIASLYDNNSGNSCWSYITVQDKLPPILDCECTPVTGFSGAITNSDPFTSISFPCWNFEPGFPDPLPGNHNYDTWNFKIAKAGMYTFILYGNTLPDPTAAIFNGPFNPGNVCANLIGGDDDANGPQTNPAIMIQLNMVPGNYTLVTTSWQSAVFGTYSWSVSGPGDIFNGNEDCFKSCSDIDQSHPIPYVIDNCSENSQPFLVNEEVEVLCHPQFVKKLTRWWIANDGHGNISDTCKQVFYLERIDFDDIVWPDTFSVAKHNAFICDAPFTDTDHDGIPDAIPTSEGGAGVPTINGQAIFPDFMFYCNSSVWFQDVPVHHHNSCVKKVMRIWTANEWHCQGEQDTLYAQLIEVVDNEGPHITCPLSFSHTTTGHSCTANIWIPAATNVFDDCSTISSITTAYPGGFKSQNGGFYAPLPVGTNVITYTAYDACYNSTQCTMTIVVHDGTPPVAVCDEHTVVSLTIGGLNGLTKVPADVFDDGSYDACGPVTFLAYRMDSCIDFDWTSEGAGLDETPDGEIDSRDHGTVPRPKVPFACCDAGNTEPIMVVLEVTDASGNVNTCMVEVFVQDKIKPDITCPSNITISCDYPLDINNLDAFGNVVTDQHDVQTWCIYDPGNPHDYDHDNFVCGIDGIATDNCQVDITVRNDDFRNQCGIGYIRRTWTAEDAVGSDVCYQYIYVKNFDPITTESIEWPEDYHAAECNLGVDPEDLPYPYDRPYINEDECDLIGVTYDDLVFPIVDGACFKILRTWKVIDWCLYEYHHGIVEGVNYWTHTQVIKVINQFGPEFTTTQPTIDSCNYTSCDGLYLELIQRAEDICTPDDQLQNGYAIDYWNDGDIDEGPFTGYGAEIDASGVFPLGHHRIIYSFEDRCGNRTVREQLINLNSCKPPVPVCHFLSTNLMQNGEVTIWASDFNASSYHPCDLPFVYSLSPDINVQSITFTCAHVGVGEIPVNLYVTDELGNQDHCETTILVTDNFGVCPGQGNLTGTITGNVSTETHDNVLNVEVEINGSLMLPITTNQSGIYTFPAMPVGGSYTVVPEKNDDSKNGVSTLDLVQIQKHLLGIHLLESPYKMIAADANNSESVTAIDMVELRKLILGIYTELPNNTSWRFVDKTYSFPDPFNPWMQAWPEIHPLTGLVSGINQADFFGVKIGDVNNSVKANAMSIVPRGAGERLELIMDDRSLVSGATVEIPVYAEKAMTMEGMQFSLQMASGLQLTGVIAGQLDVTEENFGWLKDGKLTSSWNKAEGVSVDVTKPLFTLVMKAGQAAQLSHAITMVATPTSPEAYNKEDEILDLGLQFRGLETEFTFELLQNEPNPFNGATQIGFVLPANGQAQLTLFDMTGRELYKQEVLASKGLNKVEVRKDQIGAQGVVYYQVQFQGYTATKKMLIL